MNEKQENIIMGIQQNNLQADKAQEKMAGNAYGQGLGGIVGSIDPKAMLDMQREKEAQRRKHEARELKLEKRREFQENWGTVLATIRILVTIAMSSYVAIELGLLLGRLAR